MECSPVMIRLQAKRFQMTLELLVDILNGHYWELRAQAVLWVTVGSIISPAIDLTLPSVVGLLAL